MMAETMATIAAEGMLTAALLIIGYWFGGFVKGVVGFAFPMIALSVGATLLPSEKAVAYLAMPMLLTNIWQSGRDGIRAGIEALLDFRLMIAVLLGVLLLATQLLPGLNERMFSLLMGVFVVSVALAQLAGWQPRNIRRPALDIGAGAFAGFFGGLGGVWGPPVLMTLIALDIEKRRMVRISGVMFLMGCVPFFMGHFWTGVINTQTLVISAFLALPTVLGMWLGQIVQDRIDQSVFRKLVLLVLIVAGLNFLRRALMA